MILDEPPAQQGPVSTNFDSLAHLSFRHLVMSTCMQSRILCHSSPSSELVALLRSSHLQDCCFLSDIVSADWQAFPSRPQIFIQKTNESLEHMCPFVWKRWTFFAKRKKRFLFRSCFKKAWHQKLDRESEMSRKELTDDEIKDISEKSGVEADIIRSWFKGEQALHRSSGLQVAVSWYAWRRWFL